ncbi:MAG: diphosphate--fructose-6-phosphate 1-phosphotransferase [Bacteroidales bacterium]|nr:diphosphate--fructose-6-phosphate 1-phosphotransferase [Bacteroidales bacterium]
MKHSPLQIARSWYMPKMPVAFQGDIELMEGDSTEAIADEAEIEQRFPYTYGQPIIHFTTGKPKEYPQIAVGVILSGGQAPGGHNVISGLYDGLKRINPANKLYGFIDGPGGFLAHKYIEITKEIVDAYRNTGGFDMIGSDRTKLETEEQFERCLDICRQLSLKAVVIVGGDDSNTNACMLAEYFKQKITGIQVIGCPKTIDGDLKNGIIETSFGFDTACKVYSELIGNIQRDAASSKKYWHFIRLMGRSASHITLECALMSQPNVTIISEEIAAKNMTLADVVNDIARIIIDRADVDKNYGTVLIPEGLIEFIPAFSKLIKALNNLLAKNEEFVALPTADEQREYIKGSLNSDDLATFRSLPIGIASQLTRERDPHGNIQVSLIETEKLLIEMVAKRLAQLKAEGVYKGKFAAIPHFFGYEGRCAIPSNFDADYTYSLGYTAAYLIANGKTGYMAAVKNLSEPASMWQPIGVPITMLMNMEQRNGEMKPVIRKALVDLNDAPFKYLEKKRREWAINHSHFIYPGPIQYFGPSEVCDQPTNTLLLEQGKEI